MFDFTHLSEFSLDTCRDGGEECSSVSPATREVFLPHRRDVQQSLLLSEGCGFGDGEDGDFIGDVDGGDGDGDGDGDGEPLDAGEGASDVPVAVRSTPVFTEDTTLDDLIQADETARDGYDDQVTLGGQMAGITHGANPEDVHPRSVSPFRSLAAHVLGPVPVEELALLGLAERELAHLELREQRLERARAIGEGRSEPGLNARGVVRGAQRFPANPARGEGVGAGLRGQPGQEFAAHEGHVAGHRDGSTRAGRRE
jgi:hypothetical protein